MGLYIHNTSDRTAGAMNTVQHRADLFDHTMKESPCRSCKRYAEEFPGCRETTKCPLYCQPEPIYCAPDSAAAYGKLGGRPKGKKNKPRVTKQCPICGGTIVKPPQWGKKIWDRTRGCCRKCGHIYSRMHTQALKENAAFDAKKEAVK